jgi:hypothetical protein
VDVLFCVVTFVMRFTRLGGYVGALFSGSSSAYTIGALVGVDALSLYGGGGAYLQGSPTSSSFRLSYLTECGLRTHFSYFSFSLGYAYSPSLRGIQAGVGFAL